MNSINVLTLNRWKRLTFIHWGR
uniref:Uncharacterized protein n=1 Tax=Anguilla anguilla TaxID=7936 RepID=A0A0E9XYM1_ANGAN